MVAALALGACGGGTEVSTELPSGSDVTTASSMPGELAFSAADLDEAELVEVIEEKVINYPLSPASDPVSANCVAERVVDELGRDRFVELDISPETELVDLEFTDGEVEHVTSAIMDCVDMNEYFVNQFVASGLEPDVAACMFDSIGDDLIRDAVRGGVSGNPLEASGPMTTALTEAGEACGDA